MSLPGTPKVPFGGDYNPEQWPWEVTRRDAALFDAAHLDTVTVGVFTWALTQPAAGVHDFSTVDRIVADAAALRLDQPKRLRGPLRDGVDETDARAFASEEDGRRTPVSDARFTRPGAGDDGDLSIQTLAHPAGKDRPGVWPAAGFGYSSGADLE